MDTYRRVSAGIGLCAMVVGLGVLVVPSLGTAGPLDRGDVTASMTGRILLVAGFLVVGYLTVGLRRPSDTGERSAESRRFDRASSHSPEAGAATGQELVEPVGDIDAAIEHGGPAYQAVTEYLRESVIAVLTDVHGISEDVAREAVDHGEWCGDRVAKAFLAGDAGPSPTRTEQLRLFILPERERRRRIERTVSAIERVQSNE